MMSMLIMREIDALVHRTLFPRIITAISLLFVVLGVMGLTVGIFYIQRDSHEPLAGDEIAAPEPPAEQRAFIEARMQSGADPELSQEQRTAVEERIGQDAPREISAEQRALIEQRLGS